MEFPDWNLLYKNNSVESMPWFNKDLDLDLAKELERRRITKGRFLDLGTGPGTQAKLLAKLGFTVVGTDISEHAVRKASREFSKAVFTVDDILDTKFPPNGFDYIFDRGCFHVLAAKDREQYVKNVKKILKNNGLLFLKCFSTKETQLTSGPYRFSKNNIREMFGSSFEIESVSDTVYQGTLEVFPKALFTVMKKK